MTRMLAAIGRLLRGMLALAVLLALLGGIPWLLASFIGWPLPDHLPRLAEVGSALASPLDDQKILNLLALAAWALWLLFLRDVLVEAVLVAHDAADARRGRPRPPRSSPRGPVRLTAAVLVGAIAAVLLLDSLRGAASATTSRAVANASAHASAVAVAVVHPEAVETVAAHGPRPAVAASTVVTVAAHAEHGDTTIPSWARDAPGGVHRVVKDDNLWNIAKQELGDPYRWREIYVLNRGKPQHNGYALTDPDEIHIGWVLALPAHGQARPHTPEADSQKPAPTSAKTAAPGGAAAPASQTPTSTDPAVCADSSPTEAAPHTTPTTPASAEDAHRHGVSLPSQGWASLGLATSIAAAAALLRLQHRRHARLRFPIPTATSPQPAPVSPSLSTVDTAGSRQLEVDAEESMSPGLLPAPPATPAPIGINQHGNEISLFALPGPGLALTGPGALAAARAVLAATLSTGVVQYLAARPIVVTTRDMLRRLLPAGAEPVGLDPTNATFDGERLIVLPDAGSAITQAEEEMIHRRRLLDTMDADSVTELNARDAPEYQPPYVLLVAPDTRHAPRLGAIAAHRQTLDIHPVLLGTAEDTPTVTVEPDGTVTTEPGTDGTPGGLVRMGSLSAQDLADVLVLVARVAPRPEPGTDVDDPPPAEDDVAETIPVEIPHPSGETPPLAHLAVLGPVTVTTDEGPIGAGMRSGSYGTLAMLAAYPKGCTLDQLVTGLYPDTDPSAAAKRVRSDITTTRRVLRQATNHPDAKFVLYDPGTGLYQLDPDTIDVDLWRMLAAIGHANAAADDDTACLAALQTAVACYGGDFATGQDRAWATDYATTIRHQILSAFARIAEIVETDHPDQALDALEQAVEHDPINEELYQRVMRIQGRLGRLDAVRRTLHILENRLADLAEAEVSEATRRVAARQLHPTPIATRGGGGR